MIFLGLFLCVVSLLASLLYDRVDAHPDTLLWRLLTALPERVFVWGFYAIFLGLIGWLFPSVLPAAARTLAALADLAVASPFMF